MATPSEKLASSLEILKELQSKGNAAIKGSDLTQTHRERLIANGFIKSVLKGWYIPTKPDDKKGDSTSWYASFWEFSKAYLNDRFSDNWVLSPEQSIAIHSGNWSIPKQLLVRSPEANNNSTDLLFGTSIFDIKSKLPDDTAIESINGIRILSLPHALIQCSPSLFTRSSIDARTALALMRDASQVLDPLLTGGHSVIAGRLSGAFRNIGNTRIADDIVSTMRSAGYDIREQDPFDQQTPSAFNLREKSPYVNRISMMWSDMREIVLEYFPEPPGLPNDKEKYIKSVEDIFVADAYNSLSIEGYMVTEELIERVRSGSWNPEQNEEDLQQRNAMAARGYWQAFQLVKASIKKVLSGKNAGQILDADHGGWYRELFAPSVAAGILKPSDLAGYRNGPVYIKNSQHVPLNRDALRDAMPAFFELLEEEPEASVRTLLGHFIFVYIHPYMDGNGRMARFLMNTMLASGGYPWTIIEVKERKVYMEALEEASVRHNIKDFAEFVGNKVKEQMMKN
ncbi:cell filamentation protein Fic [Fulvivirga sp. M361]|uniref:Fic family protein n=1 Tax=Fulvivirga sp. M361 TaxID=2594266 RepID=UPI00117B16FF|nr:Fic family protein [Fulvivirga sp. M361]TRX54375.1 cell filamentation protein Fic [Fulvivirga sp. M361]